MTREISFPEDQVREDYIYNGGSAALYDWRKLTFAEHLLEIKKDIVNDLDSDQKSFTRDEVDKLLNAAFVNVQHLINGDGPTLAKFKLVRYLGELRLDQPEARLVTLERPEHVDPEDYWALVNN